ncbi:TIGR01620 family protein [Roseobacter sp. HKCCA0434]|uniref:YcjF family protein n=1 Tax=Roseobacter sp. HKCCA0434 TaxID=3079297 RepID=UPI002905DD2F|nr:TIGR01620 family protein [Roseobacter sp. HKCCA0434]
MTRRPILIEDDLPEARITPADAPPVPEAQGRAMVQATRMAAKRRGWFARIFWGALVSLLLVMMGEAAWSFAAEMIARNVWLGRFVLLLVAIVGAGLLLAALRELIALSRLAKVDDLRHRAERATQPDRARAVAEELATLYAGRSELGTAVARTKTAAADLMDADAILALAERELLAPLDLAARAEVEAATRTVAGVTALLPLALADVVAALSANLRMIRRIAEIYGGRAGLIGSWRLFRTVAAHLIATGAVAVGDDMIGAVAGGGLLSKLSRRFGEGVVNGALTARVGVAAIEVCRPLPFTALRRPSVTNLMQRSLTGLFAGKPEA